MAALVCGYGTTGFADTDTAAYAIQRVRKQGDPCDRSADVYSYPRSWYDDTQVYFNTRLCMPALWFDSFFASDRLFEEGVPGTYARWRNEFTLDEEDHFRFRTALSFSAELPALKNRLRVTFESDEENDIQDLIPDTTEKTRNSLGLQLDLNKNVRSRFSLSVTLSPRIRLRYRYAYPYSETVWLRFTQEVQNDDGTNGALSRFDFEKSLPSSLLLRATTEGRLSEAFDGVDWAQTLSLFQRLTAKSSLSYESSVNGVTVPNTRAVNFRLGLRYRRNFHRKWLFYEIAPEVTWPTTYNDQRTTVLIGQRSKWLIFFRLEVHFGNAQNRRYEQYY